MEKKKSFEATQIRLPPEIFSYIRKEAERLGISQNSLMIVLMEDGRRLREAGISHLYRADLHTENPH